MGDVIVAARLLPTLMVFDTTPGGIGISEAAFAQRATVLARAERMLVE